jgi:hypothetical protein
LTWYLDEHVSPLQAVGKRNLGLKIPCWFPEVKIVCTGDINAGKISREPTTKDQRMKGVGRVSEKKVWGKVQKGNLLVMLQEERCPQA